jgi:hypothetical protein
MCLGIVVGGRVGRWSVAGHLEAYFLKVSTIEYAKDAS